MFRDILLSVWFPNGLLPDRSFYLNLPQHPLFVKQLDHAANYLPNMLVGGDTIGDRSALPWK